MVVVNFRGTSGSGKTHAARRVMGLYSLKLDAYNENEGKSRLIGHLMTRVPPARDLFVLGRYNGPKCGGCDSMSWPGAADFICERVALAAALGQDVLLEGLMVSSWGTGRLKALSDAVGGQLHVLQLTTPLEECLAAIRDRRAERGNDKPLNPKNTESKFRSALSGARNLERLGVHVEYVDREAAFLRARELLGV